MVRRDDNAGDIGERWIWDMGYCDELAKNVHMYGRNM